MSESTEEEGGYLESEVDAMVAGEQKVPSGRREMAQGPLPVDGARLPGMWPSYALLSIWK